MRLALLLIGMTAAAAELPQANLERSIAAIGGSAVRDAKGDIVEVSLARTWASDEDVARLTQIKTIRKLDLAFTYITDAGVEQLHELPALEDLSLETVEALTDAAASYLRADKTLRRLVLRGTDITDVGMPYLAALTGLKSLDLSHTMIGDVSLESLPALSELEELNLGGTRITGINLNFLKLLPKLKKLSFDGIQRRNAGACWTPLLTDLDLDTISLLSGLEELDLGIGYSLGRTGVAVGAGNCHVTGGIQITDLGVAKLVKLSKLRSLNISGSKVTAPGLKAIEKLPLEKLSLWDCSRLDDSAASRLAAMSKLSEVDLSATAVGDSTLKALAVLPDLKQVYLTDTKISAGGVESFRTEKPGVFISWARRPEPPAKSKLASEGAK